MNDLESIMFGFKFKLESIYFTSFRRSISTSYLSSYPLPPFTTIRGLISNALGIKRDDYFLQDMVNIGIKVNEVNYSSELTKILKLKKETRKTNRFPSSPVFREFLVNPIYDIYIAGDEEIISKINNYLINPMRDLYIGSSDDLVDLNIFDPIEIFEDIDVPQSIIEGIHEDCLIERIPYKFHKNGRRYDLEEKIISIPSENFSEEMNIFDFNGEKIFLF